MPRNYSYSRNNRNKKNQKKKNQKMVPLVKQPQFQFTTPFPRRKYCQLKYAQTIDLDPLSAGITHETFTANDICDIITGSSRNQKRPMFTNQLLDVYQRFEVMSSKIKITPMNQYNNFTVPGCIYISMDNDSVLQDGTLEYVMQAGVKHCKPLLFAGISSDDNLNSRSLTYSQKKYFGTDRDRDFSGSKTDPPNDAVYFHVVADSIAGNDPASIHILVEMTFNVMFYERLETPISTGA